MDTEQFILLSSLNNIFMLFSVGIIQIGELIWCPGIRHLPGKVIITDLTLSRRCGGTFQYRFKGAAYTGVLASLVPLSSSVGLPLSFTTLIVTERSLLEIVPSAAESPLTPEDAEVNKTVAGKNALSGVPVAS